MRYNTTQAKDPVNLCLIAGKMKIVASVEPSCGTKTKKLTSALMNAMVCAEAHQHMSNKSNTQTKMLPLHTSGHFCQSPP